MLLMRARVVPQRARTFLSPTIDSSTETETCPFSSLTETSGRWVKLSEPLGPSTLTVRSAMETFTPLGTLTGFLPIRDIRVLRLSSSSGVLAGESRPLCGC
jgi:hypothetical protein